MLSNADQKSGIHGRYRMRQSDGHGHHAQDILMNVKRPRNQMKRARLSKATDDILCSRMARTGLVLLLAGSIGVAAGATFGQGLKDSDTRAVSDQNTDTQETIYVRPNLHRRFHSYLLSTFGPIQMVTLVAGSAISHADDVPPEWGQGWGAYGERFVSDVGSSTTAGTTNFLLGEALHLDIKYYPCTCKGVWPRVKHALISSLTARAGEDGHRVFSPPAIVSPYAGAFSTLTWYPARYGAKDAFRTGNYDLLDSVGMKIALEFLHPVFRKLHHGS